MENLNKKEYIEQKSKLKQIKKKNFTFSNIQCKFKKLTIGEIRDLDIAKVNNYYKKYVKHVQDITAKDMMISIHVRDYEYYVPIFLLDVVAPDLVPIVMRFYM